jgi:hypothetical protein
MNAFNRFQTNRTNLLNPLQSLAGVGQTANTTLMNANQNYGTNVSNALTNQGNALAESTRLAADARASGYLGGQESWNRAINSAIGRTMSDEDLISSDISAAGLPDMPLDPTLVRGLTPIGFLSARRRTS